MENKIQVAESGNKRTNISKEDIEQAIKDIIGHFNEKYPAYYASNI